MVSVDRGDPTEIDPGAVVDPLLWQDAQQMLDRHPAPTAAGHCVCCGIAWPCPPRRLAERAADAACRPWREGWTTRHDLNGLRALPAWRADLGENAVAGSGQHRRTPRHHRGNRGAFD